MNNRDIKVYQYGTTVRFEVEFFDFGGDPVAPSEVMLKIYNSKYQQIHSGAGLDNGGLGKYLYDYTTEEKDARLYYEWYATIDGKPSLRRGTFMTRFVG